MSTMLLEPKATCSEAYLDPALEVEVEERSPAIVVVRLRGEAADHLADDLAEELNLSVVQATRFVILDLAGLRSISRAGLRTLVEFRRAMCRRDAEVWLAGLQPAVWLALRLADQDKRFSIRDSVARVFAS